MSEFRLIEEDIYISKVKMQKMDWDVVMGDIPYQVVRIEGYVHTIGGRWGDNEYWAYPRNQQPSYENLIEFESEHPVRWGIKFEPKHYRKDKWDESRLEYSAPVTITRNGEDFYTLWGGLNYGIDKARVLISEINEHPIDFNSIDYDKRIIGRKVWWRSQPAIVTGWCRRQACVILEPDGIEKFSVPAEYVGDPLFDNEEDRISIKDEIFSEHINWFRE